MSETEEIFKKISYLADQGLYLWSLNKKWGVAMRGSAPDGELRSTIPEAIEDALQNHLAFLLRQLERAQQQARSFQEAIDEIDEILNL